MKKPSRFLNVLGAISLILSLLVGAFGTVTVSAQDEASGDSGPVVGGPSVFFPWVANDDESTGLGPADTSVTIQNLGSTEAIVALMKGIGNDSLPGDNGWELIGPFNLEAYASKTFSAAQLGIAEGEGAPVGAFGVTQTGEITSGQVEDFNQDGDFNDYETIADDDFFSGANSWMNTSPAELVTWDDDTCLVVDIDNNGEVVNIYPAGYNDGGAIGVPGGTFPGQPGGNLDGNPDTCTASESTEAEAVVDAAPLAGVAKQAVEGENLPYTSDADTVVSGYNGLAGWELIEVGNEAGPFNGWYLPIVQTNGGPGGAWNSIIRVANFGDVNGVGAAGVTVTVYPSDSAAGELNKSYSFNDTVNAGQTWSIDLSDKLPEGFIGSAHISSDAPIFAMVDRVKVGYNMWLTNTASNALITAGANPWGDGGKFVLYAPDVRKDFFGWNTGINVANLADFDNLVTIQYLGDIGAAAQSATLHAKGMTYFYDPSQGPQDNSVQTPFDPDAGTIGAAILIADAPIAAAIDATKYPESTTSEDHNIFQALSYSATKNIWFDQGVPLVQKGDPDTGMGATSGIQLFNPNNVIVDAVVKWHLPSGDTFGNPVSVVVDPNAMTFVYTMVDKQLSVGYLGSATVNASSPIAAISTQVDYAVQFDGSAVWNGYNPAAAYRDQDPQPDSILDAVVTLDGEAADGVVVNVYAADDCGGDVLYSGTTDANGEVEIPVEPGDYCVGADPNNDLNESFDEDVTIEPGDTNLDIDAEIDEAALPGIADVEVENAQCVDLVDDVETDVACDESTTGEATANTTVVIVPVADANVLCADVDYATLGESMTYDPTDNSFELQVDPGLYCAMADLDGDPNTNDRLYSLKPFEIESNDPETDVDDVLGANAYLDVQVTVDFNDGTDPQPVGGVEVTIYLANEGDTTCSGTALGTFFTDENGIVSIPVEPGFYCAEADPNMDNTVTSGSGEVPLGDPSFAQTGDIDIDLSISESVAYLDVLVTLNGEVVPEGIPVQIYRGTCDNQLGPLGDAILTDENGEITILVAPGDYCAQAYPELGGEGTTGGVDLQAGDTDESGDQSDIIIDVIVVLDVQVTLDGETPIADKEVMIYAGDCETGTPLDGNPFTTDEDGIVSVPVAPGDYCAEADPNNDLVMNNGSATLLPGDPSYADSGDIDIDIIVNEEALPGVADGTVENALCTDGEATFICEEGAPNPLGATLQQAGETEAVTQVFILSVADETVDCAAQATYVADGQAMEYDTANHFVETDVERGWYCAMADLDGEAATTDRMYSSAPFFIDSNDPANDNDFALTADAWLDVVVQQDLDGTMLPVAGAEVEIYQVADGVTECPDSGTTFGIFVSDADGKVSIPVQPGTYCATADANGDDVLATDGPEFIADGDPADDADLVITEVIAWLDVQVNLNGAPVGEGVSVEIFRGDCLTGVSLGTLATDANGQVEMLVAPGDYCAEAYAELSGTDKTGTIDDIEAGDPNDDIDITIDVVVVLDIQIQLNDEPVAEFTPVSVYLNPTDPADCTTGTELSGSPYTADDEGVISIPAVPGTYCVEADPNLDGTASTGVAVMEPGNQSYADSSALDIIINEPFAPGTADVQVVNRLCENNVDADEFPQECDDADDFDVTVTTVVIVPVADATVDCTTADYTSALAAPYNDEDNSFEVANVLPQFFCARADLDGDPVTQDYVFAAMTGYTNPFETTTSDPADDVDTILDGLPAEGLADIYVEEALCAVDTVPPADPVRCSNASAASAITVVTIVQVPNGDVDCSAVDYTTDAISTTLDLSDETFEASVAPGRYCSMADIDGVADSGDEMYSLIAYTVDTLDPDEDAATADDIIAGGATILDVDVDPDFFDFGDESDDPDVDLSGFNVLVFTGSTTTTMVDGNFVCTASQSGPPTYTRPLTAEGEAQRVVVAGDFCAQVELLIQAEGDWYTGTAALGTSLAAADPVEDYLLGDIILEVDLQPAVGTADVQVLDPDEAATSAYTVYVAPLGDLVDCSTVGFVSSGVVATFNSGDDTYERSDLEPGLYCAVADLDGDLFTNGDQVLSDEPFEVTTLDPDTDIDETLQVSILDARVTLDNEPAIDVVVNVYGAVDCSGVVLYSGTTDSAGEVEFHVPSGVQYCVGALVNGSEAVDISDTIDPGDGSDDIDAEINVVSGGVEQFGILDVEVQAADETPLGAGIWVTVYSDGASAGLGCIGGTLIGTFVTDANSQIETLVPAGNYCAHANLGSTVSSTGNVDGLDPNTDTDITIIAPAATDVIDVHTGIFDSGNVRVNGVTINVYADGLCGQAVLYSAISATIGVEDGAARIPVAPGEYCLGADPNGDGNESYDTGVASDDNPFDTSVEALIYESQTEDTGFVDIEVSSQTAATTVMIVSVVNNGDCDDLNYSDGISVPFDTDPSDDPNTFEAEVPAGEYCALTDIDGSGGSAGPVFQSDERFFVALNDPADDIDETLGVDQEPTDPTASIYISAVPTDALIDLDLFGPEEFSITVQVTNTSDSAVDGSLELAQSGLVGGIVGDLLDGTLTCDLSGTQDISVPANSTIDVTFSRTDCDIIFNIGLILDVLNHFEADLTQDGLGPADHEEWNVLIDLNLL